MKTIIAGSRDITDYNLLKKAIKDSGFKITEILSGGAEGVDKLGEKYARENNIPLTVFKPEWEVYGKSAGPIRNKSMANQADALIAIMKNKSAGTSNMVYTAKAMRLKVFVYEV